MNPNVSSTFISGIIQNCSLPNYILIKYSKNIAGKRSIRHGFIYIKSAIILNFFKSEL